MRFVFHLTMLVGIVSMPGATLGQETAPSDECPLLRPGDPRLSLKPVLAPAQTRFVLEMEFDGETQPFGEMIDHIDRLAGGTLIRVQTGRFGGRPQIDLTMADDRLGPLRHYSQNPNRTVDLQYTSGKVTGGYLVAGDEVHVIDDALAAASFDSNHIDLVARAIPLTEGFACEVATYERASAESEKTAVNYTVRYLGEEMLGAKRIALVAFQRQGDASDTRIAIDPANRSVMRMETAAGPRTLTIKPVN